MVFESLVCTNSRLDRSSSYSRCQHGCKLTVKVLWAVVDNFIVAYCVQLRIMTNVESLQRCGHKLRRLVCRCLLLVLGFGYFLHQVGLQRDVLQLLRVCVQAVKIFNLMRSKLCSMRYTGTSNLCIEHFSAVTKSIPFVT